MEIQQALREAMDEAGWPLERVALEADKTYMGAARWRKGSAPGGKTLLTLMRVLPGFARRLGFEVIRHAA